MFVLGLCCAEAVTARADPAATGPPDIVLGVKTHFRLALREPIRRVAIGDPDVLNAKITDGSDLLLRGKKLGRTTLIVWMAGESRPDQFGVVVAPNTEQLAAAFASESALSDLRVTSTRRGYILKGNVPTVEAHARAVRLAEAFVGAFVDETFVPQRQMVSVEVRFAAMSVSTLKRLGFNFSVFGRGFQAAVVGPSSGAGFTFTPGSGLDLDSGLPIRDAFNLLLAAPNVDFLSVLSALSGTRLAQVLAEPTLLVRSGEKAEFISGGEIPIPVAQDQGAIGIEYRKFGIQLNIAATVLSPDRIAMQVAPEVSELDFARGVTLGGTQVPAITTRGARTTIEIGNGQTFILAGLLSSTEAESEEKVPLLGDIPVLGSFFKYVNNTRERQELVIVATPRLVSPMKPGRLPQLPGADMRNYDPSLGDLLLNRDPLDATLERFGLMP